MGSIWNNYALWIPIIIWFLVQTTKVIIDLIVHEKFDAKRFIGSGGMPSSHSAFVASITTIAALAKGFDSLEFAICVIFSIVVMYDATGVRRAAGKQARVLNQLIENDGDIDVQEKLVELLGHTPIEVFVGAIVGIIGTAILYNLWV